MLIFIAIALASFILIAGSFIFGHDHDAGDHADASHADAAHADGHDVSHDADPTISFFSMKVLATLTMGFGAAGSIARQYGADYLISSLIGVGTGIALSLVMYFLLNMIYKQQASSLVSTSSAVGLTGIVQTTIRPQALGEVSLTVGGQYMTYLAKSAGGTEIPKGRSAKVVGLIGSQLIVEEAP